jgi:hypothetical protein
MYNHSSVFDGVEFYSSVITLPFWISVKAEVSNRFPLRLNGDESLFHPVNLSSLTREDIENGIKNYKKYTPQELFVSDILKDIGPDMLYKVVVGSNRENRGIEEQIFKSLVGTTVGSYPANFRSAFIKVQLPKIVIESTNGYGEGIHIIPFVIRRSGFEHSKILKRSENDELRDYIFFIELVLIGEGELIEGFTSELFHTSKKGRRYSTQETLFYANAEWGNESATGLTQKLINSILSRVINERKIDLEEINEILSHRKIVGNLKLGLCKMENLKSENSDYTKLLRTNELDQISYGIWLYVDRYYRSYDLILEKNIKGLEMDPLDFTILNSSNTGNLATSLAVSLRYLETIERFDIARQGWAEVTHLRQSLEAFDQVFNVNQTNPTFLRTYNMAMKRLGIDELEHTVKEKFREIDYHVQSKGQLLINKNLYMLTAGLMSLGLIEILLAAIDVCIHGHFFFDVVSFVLAGLGTLVFLIIVYVIYTRNKR